MKKSLLLMLFVGVLTHILSAQCINNTLSAFVNPDCAQVYPGYEPLACTDLTLDVSGGTSPYSFLWSTGETTDAITVCPGGNSIYRVTITDANGCSRIRQSSVFVTDVTCGNNGRKVLVCHIPPGNPENAHTICISPNGVPAHLAHGCHLGECNAIDPCDEETEHFVIPNHVIVADVDNQEPQAWPNPGENELNIAIPSYAGGLVTVNLVSFNGKTIRSLSLAEGTRSGTFRDLNSIAEGIYFIRINDADGNSWVLRWTKIN